VAALLDSDGGPAAPSSPAELRSPLSHAAQSGRRLNQVPAVLSESARRLDQVPAPHRTQDPGLIRDVERVGDAAPT
jgi:hypothetical protein